MKNLSCLLTSISVAAVCFGQSTPITPIETLNTFTGATSIFAPYELHSPYSSLGPVVIYNTAQVDYTAGERVHLQPGFQSGNFSGSGYFHAQIGAPPAFDVVFIEPNESYPQVGQFEKLEIGLQLDAQLEQQIESFTQNSATGINPFDPNQISVEAQFIHGSESYTVFGFYYEEYLREPWPWMMDPCNLPGSQCFSAAWYDQNTPYHWRIRFAPPGTGEWKVNIRVYLGAPATVYGEVADVRFNCVTSSNPGFLEVGADGWHLRYSGTHQSFFGIGQDLGWPDASQFRGDVDPTYEYRYRGGYLDILDWITDMSAKGGNMTRVVKVPWSYEYEWEELNNYSQRLNRAWELDRLFETAELTDVEMVFCFEHGTYTLDDTGTYIEPDLNWLYNPYNTQLPNVDFPDDFLTFQSCRDVFKKKLRYFMSRWGYSTSLGIFQILSEMDRWTFRDQTHVPNLKHNDDAKVALLNWHTEMLAYSKSLLQYRELLCSSSFGDAPRDYAIDCPYNSPYIDIVCPKHGYHTKRDDNLDRFKEMNDGGFSPGVHHMFPNKPALTDEMGFNDKGGVNASDMDYCSDVTFHNSIWATSFNGGLNSGLYWWQWFNNDHRENFTALSQFFGTVDFESERFIEPDHWEDANDADNVSIENFYLSSALNGNRRVMGWVHNASYYWGNILPGTCFNPDNQTTPIDGDTNDDENISDPTELTDGTKFEIHHLTIFSDYSIDFYYTRGNGAYHSTQYDNAGLFGTLKPTWIPGEGDWAYKAYRSGAEFRTAEQSTIDTLGCAPYTVDASGRHELDSNGNFSYTWYFGDGTVLNGNPVSYTYMTSGTYNAKVIISGPEDFIDTLVQTVVVLDCENGNSRVMQLSFLSDQITLVPNPTSGRLNFNSSDQEISIIEVYSLQGQFIFVRSVYSHEGSIDLSDLASGVYCIHFLREDNSVSIKKILKE